MLFFKGCTEVKYLHDLSWAELSPAAIRRTRLQQQDEAWDSHYVGSNLARVNVFMMSPTITSHKRNELFGPVDFVSGVGGLLGLFLGVSALSLVEVLYHFLSGIFFKGRKTTELGRKF